MLTHALVMHRLLHASSHSDLKAALSFSVIFLWKKSESQMSLGRSYEKSTCCAILSGKCMDTSDCSRMEYIA